jgi:primosomal protein N' (replication factor Y)
LDKNNPSLITVVPLGDTYIHGSLISHEVYTLIDDSIKSHEGIVLFYNRRGLGRAWICEDCGNFPTCPECDIALAYHTSPKKQLICHNCNYRSELVTECSKCQGHTFRALGIGLQKIASDLHEIFPHAHIVRVDSDSELEP